MIVFSHASDTSLTCFELSVPHSTVILPCVLVVPSEKMKSSCCSNSHKRWCMPKIFSLLVWLFFPELYLKKKKKKSFSCFYLLLFVSGFFFLICLPGFLCTMMYTDSTLEEYRKYFMICPRTIHIFPTPPARSAKHGRRVRIREVSNT